MCLVMAETCLLLPLHDSKMSHDGGRKNLRWLHASHRCKGKAVAARAALHSIGSQGQLPCQNAAWQHSRELQPRQTCVDRQLIPICSPFGMMPPKLSTDPSWDNVDMCRLLQMVHPGGIWRCAAVFTTDICTCICRPAMTVKARE